MELKSLIGPLVTAAIFLIVYIRDRARTEGNWEEKFKHTLTKSGAREMLAELLTKESHGQMCEKEQAKQETRNANLKAEIVDAMHKMEGRLLKAIKESGKQAP